MNRQRHTLARVGPVGLTRNRCRRHATLFALLSKFTATVSPFGQTADRVSLFVLRFHSCFPFPTTRTTSDSRLEAIVQVSLSELGRGKGKENREESDNARKKRRGSWIESAREFRDIARPLWYGNAVAPRPRTRSSFSFLRGNFAFRSGIVERLPVRNPIESLFANTVTPLLRQALINSLTRFPFVSTEWNFSDPMFSRSNVKLIYEAIYVNTFLVLLIMVRTRMFMQMYTFIDATTQIVST